MAKKKKTSGAIDADSFISNFLADSAANGSSLKAYLADDHARYTFGVDIPLVLQYLFGEANKLRCQIFLGVSGLRASTKSMFVYELGNYVMNTGGVHFAIDTENKTSPSLMAALTRGHSRKLQPEKFSSKRRVFSTAGSIEDWQEQTTEIIDRFRELGGLPKGKRVAGMVSVDSMMARTTEEQQTKLAKEGHSEGRGYPVANAMITNYLESVSLRGTTAIFAYVQHMKEAIDSMAHGKQYREKGPSAAEFAATLHLRLRRIKSFNVVYHPARWVDGPPCEGHTIQIDTHKSCMGPDKRRIQVDVLWQYIDEEDEEGNKVANQYMTYDWWGALGNLLISMKYGEKKACAHDVERLNEALLFTVSGKDVKCKELGLDGVSVTEFGRAIEHNPEVKARVSHFLRIKPYTDFQEADIEALDA